MRAFSCETCGQLLFFENAACLNCGTEVGFLPEWRKLIARHGRPWCANAAVAGCNWLVEREGLLCDSCVLTRARPADDDLVGRERFVHAEVAKRWLLFELAEHDLPVDGLAFELLSSEHGPVTTGHLDGVVTLDLAEVDPAHRAAVREQLGEPYRTVLGHLRHEVGHFFWPQLVQLTPLRDGFRALFGDERADYGEALDRHYREGPAPDWQERHVSAYASMHPAEDWAETFAHYLHITDSGQTAAEFGLRTVGPRATGLAAPLAAQPDRDHSDLRDLLADWLPLTYALNALNRSMGHEDLYPFVLTEAVIEKLAFVDAAVRERPRGA